MMNARSFRFLCVGLLCLLTVPTHAEDQPLEATAHLKGEEKEVADMVIRAQLAGWAEHDVDRYMTQWADKATLTWGRSEKPGQYDQTIDRETIHSSRAIRMRGEPPGYTYHYERVAVELNGDQAVLTLRAQNTAPDQSFYLLIDERYELKKMEGQWKVVMNRAWPVAQLSMGTLSTFDQRRWEELDRAVEDAKQDSDQSHASALMDAYRFDEAHLVMVKATRQRNATAIDWVLRGIFAAIAGVSDDVDPSFKKAHSMDPGLRLPPFAPEALRE